MMNFKKKALTVLSLAFAFSLVSTGAVCSLTASATDETLSIDAGASIKVVGTTEDNYVDTETGIRFSATVAPTLVSSLGENDYVGMMIVPSKVITAYNNQDGEVEKDYLQFIANVKGDEKANVEEKVSCRYDTAELSKEQNSTVYGVIASVKDANYNENYQAVAYYVKDGAYNYMGVSDTGTITQVADKALLDTEFAYTTQDKNALGNIIEKSIVMKNGTDGATVTPIALKTWETKAGLKATYASEINDPNLTITTADNTVASVENDVLTGLQTAGETTLNIKAYDGNVNLPITVTSTAEKGSATTIHSSSGTAYTAYGAMVGATENKNTFTNLPAVSNINLGIGSLAKGGSMANLSSLNVPYFAMQRTSIYNSGYALALEFTGNNMPMIGFFVADDSTESPMQNVVGRKGVLASNGFKTTADDNISFLYSLTAFGFSQLTKNPLKNDESLADGTENVRLKADGSIDNKARISYKALEETPDQKYRLFIRATYTETNHQGKVTLEIKLYTVDENGYNGSAPIYELGGAMTAQSNYYADFAKGNIVLYGRPYQTTKIDKVYLSTSTAINTTSKIITQFNAPA